MSDSSTLPIRVLVKGASTVVWTSWMGGPRTDFAYPRVIEAELRAAGIPAEVRVTAKASERTRDAVRNWEHDVVQWSPDVVVLHYGHFETMHLFLPSKLERFVNAPIRRPGRLSDLFWLGLMKKSWLALATLQQQLDRHVDPRARWRRPRRVAADLERVIGRIRNVGSPLVLVPDLLSPCGKWTSWFPAMEARVEVMNATLDELVSRIGQQDVRRFRVTDVVAGLDLDEEPAPDGGHYSPEVHRAVGQGMAEVIREWASHQPHLRPPTERPSAIPSLFIEPPVARPKEPVS